jgi:hypothetical protein
MCGVGCVFAHTLLSQAGLELMLSSGLQVCSTLPGLKSVPSETILQQEQPENELTLVLFMLIFLISQSNICIELMLLLEHARFSASRSSRTARTQLKLSTH